MSKVSFFFFSFFSPCGEIYLYNSVSDTHTYIHRLIWVFDDPPAPQESCPLLYVSLEKEVMIQPVPPEGIAMLDGGSATSLTSPGWAHTLQLQIKFSQE